jgi:hypothetical protein
MLEEGRKGARLLGNRLRAHRSLAVGGAAPRLRLPAMADPKNGYLGCGIV